jgi:nucleotide-binding universal stress UspA family protein
MFRIRCQEEDPMDFTDRIVVGHDGSTQAEVALRWAAGLAARTGRELAIVHAWVWPLVTDDLGPADGVAGSGHRNVADALLREAATVADAAAPGLEVSTHLVVGRPRDVLEKASDTARLVVVGSRGLGGFLGMMLGSVALALITHAGCPVVVVRDEDIPAGPVVVGVDDSEAALDATRTGAELAAELDLPLHIVHIRRSTGEGPGEAESDVQRPLEAATARARLAAPGRPVETSVLQDRNTAGGLLEAARDGGILVLGHRGTGGRRFGSVAHAVVHHAPCATVVVRHVRDEADPAAQVRGADGRD